MCVSSGVGSSPCDSPRPHQSNGPRGQQGAAALWSLWNSNAHNPLEEERGLRVPAGGLAESGELGLPAAPAHQGGLYIYIYRHIYIYLYIYIYICIYIQGV